MVGWVWAIAFLILGIIAGVFGFGGIAGTSTWIAQVLFFLFLIAFVVTLLWSRGGSLGSKRLR
jgi:uncharacterized membrane protein YtjA (UPF0391 family)